MKLPFIKDIYVTCFNMWNFQIFKKSKSRVYVVVLCFQKHNAQYTKWSFAEIYCCKIDFLRHKFSDIQSMSTLEQFAPIVKYSEFTLELNKKMNDPGNIECSCILCRWLVPRIKVLFMQHTVDVWNCFDVNVVCSNLYGCYVHITLVFAYKGYIY